MRNLLVIAVHLYERALLAARRRLHPDRGGRRSGAPGTVVGVGRHRRQDWRRA